MITISKAYELMKATAESLVQSGLVADHLTMDKETILLGTGSGLDSIAFVTFMTDLEDRINRETGADVFLVLSEIHDFNTSSLSLTAETLAQYIVKSLGG